MKYLWGMINVLQLITIQSMMSINIPPLPRAINKIILDMTQIDILPSDKILEFLFPSDDEDDKDEDAINAYFE